MSTSGLRAIRRQTKRDQSHSHPSAAQNLASIESFGLAIILIEPFEGVIDTSRQIADPSS